MRLVYTHMGLGDHIICCGLLNELRKREPIATFVKPHNYQSVAAMLDTAKIPLIVTAEDNVADFAATGPIGLIGHMWWDRTGPFDKAFYDQAQIDFRCRWDSFAVRRDRAAEARMMLATRADRGPYCFVHDDEDRGFKIDPGKLPDHLPVIRPVRGLTANIFDYLAVMEGADEIHVINSAFAIMADSVGNWTQPMVFHRYARDDPQNEVPTWRLPWRVLT